MCMVRRPKRARTQPNTIAKKMPKPVRAQPKARADDETDAEAEASSSIIIIDDGIIDPNDI